MIRLTIEEREYFGPSQWSDITLDQFIRVCAIDVPDRLRNLYIATADLVDAERDNETRRKSAQSDYDVAGEAITVRDLSQRFPAYYGEIIRILTDIPDDVIERLHPDVRTDMYDQYFRWVVLSAFMGAPLWYGAEGMVPYEPDPMDKFDVDGITYHFPKSLRIYNDVVPMASEPVASFAEASEIISVVGEMRERGVERLPMFMAVYCRPASAAEYNQREAIEREPIMRNAPMNAVWSLFFYTHMLLRKYGRFTRGFLRVQGKEIAAHDVPDLINSDGGEKYTR